MATILLTGLPCSGKTTLAKLLKERVDHDRPFGKCIHLDGDGLRQGINADLGFSYHDRNENIRRVSELALLLNQNKVNVIVSVVAPFEVARMRFREKFRKFGLPFIEVFVDADKQVCINRDVKGHYAQALTGGRTNFTGVGSDYEIPPQPELHIRTDHHGEEECVQQIYDVVRRFI
jgi:adenylylsulfate kinase